MAGVKKLALRQGVVMGKGELRGVDFEDFDIVFLVARGDGDGGVEVVANGNWNGW